MADDWKEIKPLPVLRGFCNCIYCRDDRCHYWTKRGRRMTGFSTPSWCPIWYPAGLDALKGGLVMRALSNVPDDLVAALAAQTNRRAGGVR